MAQSGTKLVRPAHFIVVTNSAWRVLAWSPMHADLFRSSRGSGPPLRVGLLLDGSALERCFAEVIDQIAQCDFARITLLVFNDEAQPFRPAADRQPLPQRASRP